MKTKEELTTAINVLVDIYDRNVNRIDPDKHLAFHIQEAALSFFVKAAWLEGTTGGNENPILDNSKEFHGDDHFTILRSELFDKQGKPTVKKLESYINDVLDKVTLKELV